MLLLNNHLEATSDTPSLSILLLRTPLFGTRNMFIMHIILDIIHGMIVAYEQLEFIFRSLKH